MIIASRRAVFGAAGALAALTALSLALATGSATAAVAPAAAFSGAVGFGASATGGTGDSVYHVTNLNDSGSGSFRDAVSSSNRIVDFSVGGYISLSSAVSVASNITIEGDTAPGQGIGIMGREVSFANSKNDIVRYVRFRQGTLDSDSGKSSLSLSDAGTMIFDHVSIEFGQWDDVDAVGATNITFQNSLIADPIGQQFGAHTETGPFTWYHDVFANSHNRNPLAKDDTQFLDSVDYNYQAAYTAGNTGAVYTHDIVDDYFIAGPSTTSASDDFYQMNSQKVYSSGNLLDSNKNGSADGSSISLGGGAVALSAPWASTTTSIATQSAHSAYTWLLTNVGDLPHDSVDSLVVADVSSAGTSGHLWTSQTQTGLGNDGYGTITG
ncbi:hypothetical protein [Actinospica robiniae]|uniref:hypothetical protein n=1 Tax=Actinospica robiniae TaxID=304901 RepID=UPI000408B180|nr:hypothetical protein [Actinospica robiniae]